MSRRWRLPLLVFCLALIPRLVFLSELHARSPTFDRPEGGDSIFYDRVASGESTPRRAYFHSPLYQWFLRGAYAVFGRNLLAVRLLQHLLGALTALLVFFTVRRLLGSDGLALGAALLQAWFGPGIFYEGQLLVDALLPLLVAACGLAFVHLFDRPTARLAVGFGLLVGVAALGRATVLLWVPLAAGWLILRGRHWGKAALVAAGVAAVVLPVTVRNYVVERDLVAITSNGGINLYIGNNPRAEGTYNLPQGLWFRPGDPADDFAGVEVGRVALGHVPRSSELSAWWTRRALHYMRTHPGRTLRLTARKAAMLVDNYEQPQLYNYYAYRELCGSLRWLPGAGIALALGLLGMVLAWTSLGSWRLRRYSLFVAGFALAYLPFFVAGRYRSPIVALICGFALWALALLVDAGRQRRWWRCVGLALAVLAALAFSFYPVGPRPRRAQQYYAFGQAALALGDGRAAVGWFRRAIRDQPGHVAAHAELGHVLLEQGQLRRARRVLERARRRFPHHGLLLLYSGQAYAALSEWSRAEEVLRRAIDRDPACLEAWTALGDMAWRRGRLDMAEQAYRSALVLAKGASAMRRWQIQLSLEALRARRQRTP